MEAASAWGLAGRVKKLGRLSRSAMMVAVLLLGCRMQATRLVVRTAYFLTLVAVLFFACLLQVTQQMLWAENFATMKVTLSP